MLVRLRYGYNRIDQLSAIDTVDLEKISSAEYPLKLIMTGEWFGMHNMPWYFVTSGSHLQLTMFDVWKHYTQESLLEKFPSNPHVLWYIKPRLVSRKFLGKFLETGLANLQRIQYYYNNVRSTFPKTDQYTIILETFQMLKI